MKDWDDWDDWYDWDCFRVWFGEKRMERSIKTYPTHFLPKESLKHMCKEWILIQRIGGEDGHRDVANGLVWAHISGYSIIDR